MEQIDEMRKRTNCSYQEAKELLEKNNGDLLEAIVEFEKKYGYKEKNKHQERKERKGKIKGLFAKAS
jgi:translation elongation factor EF-Ts